LFLLLSIGYAPPRGAACSQLNTDVPLCLCSAFSILKVSDRVEKPAVVERREIDEFAVAGHAALLERPIGGDRFFPS